MDETILKKVLQLDSLLNFLQWDDRAQIHHYCFLNKKVDPITSKKVLAAFVWIIKEKWEAPKRKYKDDRILYFYDPDSDTWLPDEDYLKLNSQYKEELTNLKYF